MSIILPVYNGEPYLDRAIASVLAQTMPDWELLLLDDASTDGSFRRMQVWAARDGRIRVLRNACNLGVADTRNRGMEAAAGAYIAFLDSDDLWRADKLERQVAVLERTGLDLCASAYRMIDARGNPVRIRMPRRQEMRLEDLLKENYICCSSVLLRSSVAKQHKMDGTYIHEDYVYWLELLQAGARGCVLDACLTDYRVSGRNRSGNKWRAARGRWQVYRRFLHYGVARSGRYFLHYACHGAKKYAGYRTQQVLRTGGAARLRRRQ